MAFGGFDQKDSFAPMSEINTTPLVDVMLVLLIIFIVTAPMLTSAIPVNLPVAGNNAVREKPDVITLSLNAEGTLFWNDTPIQENELLAKLTQASSKNPQPEIRLRADRDTRYQRITDIMAQAQKAGIQKLGFVNQVQSTSR